MLTVLTLSLALLAGGAPAAPASTQSPLADGPVVLPVSIGDIGALSSCSASAECGTKPDVSCEDITNPASCHAYDTDCSTGFIGYVVCDGVRKDCPSDSCPCSSICCNGDTRTVPTGQCCFKDPCGGERFRNERCVNGQWEFESLAGCEPTLNCPAFPC